MSKKRNSLLLRSINRLFLFYFPSYLLSSEIIFAASFAPLCKKQKEKEFDTFYFTLLIFVAVILLVWFCFALVQKKKKKIIVKSEIFPTFYLIFVAVFRLLFNFRCSHPLSLVLLCSS